MIAGDPSPLGSGAMSMSDYSKLQAVNGRHAIGYDTALAAVTALSGLDGFVCIGPAPSTEVPGVATPGVATLSGTTWISALPVAESDPALDLRTNLGHLRQQRLERLGPGPESGLPAVVGVVHYEAAYQLIPKLAPLAETLVQSRPPENAPSGLAAALYTWGIDFDHDRRQAFLSIHRSCPVRTREAVLQLLESPPKPEAAITPKVGPFRALQDAATYKGAVERIRDYISAGDCYQANLSQQFEASIEGSGWMAFKALSRLFPTPQSAFLSLNGSEILSLSPEVFINVEGGQVETRPIKGTRPRGETAEADAALALALEQSEKDRAENLMIVDLLRNDLGRICETGSVNVESLFKLESYANVHHLVSTVTGRLRADIDALDALVGSFPGGSITGAPKIRAMEIIAELEPHRRGPYCGSVFRWDAAGNLRSNIAIRTLWREGNRIRCWGGAGIVHDSDAEAEYQETLTKVRLLMDTLESLGRGEAPPEL